MALTITYQFRMTEGANRNPRPVGRNSIRTCRLVQDKQERIPLPSSVFTVSSPGAGAGDSISRIALVYDLVTSVYELDFELPKYKNHHCTGLDFLELFGLKTAFPAAQTSTKKGLPTKRLSIKDFVADELSGKRRVLKDGVRYVFEPAYRAEIPMEEFARRFGYGRRLFGKMSYEPASQVFEPAADARRCVIHLRRHDICGTELFDGLDHDTLPAEVKRGIQSRALLEVPDAVKRLEAHFAPGTRVDVVVATDGFARLRERFAEHPELLVRVDRLEERTLREPSSSILDIRLRERIIGRDADATRRTLDAMYGAEVIVSRSSSFPFLPTSTLRDGFGPFWAMPSSVK